MMLKRTFLITTAAVPAMLEMSFPHSKTTGACQLTSLKWVFRLFNGGMESQIQPHLAEVMSISNYLHRTSNHSCHSTQQFVRSHEIGACQVVRPRSYALKGRATQNSPHLPHLILHCLFPVLQALRKKAASLDYRG